jgi:hypothetical protein
LIKKYIATALQVVGCAILTAGIATFSTVIAVLFAGSVILLFGLAVERSE